MKKIVSMFIALALCLGLTAAVAETVPGFDKAPEKMGIVLILNSNLGDHAINDLSYAGLQMAAEKYGFNYKCVELGGDATLQIPTMEEYAEDPDYDIIMCGTNNLRESAQIVAQEYPEQLFILYDTQDDLGLENIFSMDHAQNEGAYIAGVAAALLTKTGIVGFVGGGENTALDDYLIGYIQGVHATDPDINILISWIGDFKDTAKGKELATSQAQQGADVVFSVAGGAGLGILSGAAESGIYAIGVDSDQYTSLLESNPDIAKCICTSMFKQADVTVSTLIGMAMEGSMEWGAYVKWGLKEGVVGLAMDNDNYRTIFTDDQKAAIAEVQAAATNGELTIESAIGMDNDRLQEIFATATK